jgi:hypothetical protein
MARGDIDRELLGRVASLTPAQQRWLRTVLASIFSMDDAARLERREELERRPLREPAERGRRPRREEPVAEQPSGLDKVLSGEGVTEEEYPELADELQGIADIASLLRESGRERRRFGEEILRLLEMEPSDEEGGEEKREEL